MRESTWFNSLVVFKSSWVILAKNAATTFSGSIFLREICNLPAGCAHILQRIPAGPTQGHDTVGMQELLKMLDSYNEDILHRPG